MNEVYSQVYEFDAGPFNTIVVGTREETGAEAMRQNLSEAPGIVHPLAEEIAGEIRPAEGSGEVLTDDRAPVEWMTDLAILDFVRGGGTYRESRESGEMKMMTWSILLAVAAGAAIAVQFAVNGELRGAVGSPLLAAGISFLIGTVILFAGVLVTRGVPSASAAAGAPWWAWAGGLLGAFFVFASVVLTPRLGAASTIAFIIAGQMVASIILDQFGLLNVPAQPASFLRLGGAALVISGAYYLVLRF